MKSIACVVVVTLVTICVLLAVSIVRELRRPDDYRGKW